MAVLNIRANCKVAEVCKQLLATYTGDELQVKLAEHTADEWLDLYKPRIFTDSLPAIMVRYQGLKTEKERDSFNKDNPDWINGEEMVKYADRKRRVEGENESHRWYLKDTLQYLAHDPERARKVKNVLAMYQHAKVGVGGELSYS